MWIKLSFEYILKCVLSMQQNLFTKTQIDIYMHFATMYATQNIHTPLKKSTLIHIQTVFSRTNSQIKMYPS